MKLLVCFLFCAILTLQYNGVDGSFKSFFEDVGESVKNTAHKAGEGIHNLFHPNKVDTNAKDKATDAKDGATEAKEESVPKDSASGDVKQDIKPVETTTLAPTTTTANGTGRENFGGACMTGYIRTPDGRCKPTF